MDTLDIRKEAEEFIDEIRIIDDNKKAFEYSIDIANEDDLVLWCGSLYLVGKILSFI